MHWVHLGTVRNLNVQGPEVARIMNHERKTY